MAGLLLVVDKYNYILFKKSGILPLFYLIYEFNTGIALFVFAALMRGMGFAKIMIFAATADFCCRKPAYCRLPNPCGEPPCSVAQIQHNTHI